MAGFGGAEHRPWNAGTLEKPRKDHQQPCLLSLVSHSLNPGGWAITNNLLISTTWKPTSPSRLGEGPSRVGVSHKVGGFVNYKSMGICTKPQSSFALCWDQDTKARKTD